VNLANMRGNELAPVSALSQQERACLEMLIDGHSARSIAASLGLASGDAELSVTCLMKKLGVKSRADAVRIGLVARLAGPS
jgi:DNA-binding NarL/FixJ family response regulator